MSINDLTTTARDYRQILAEIKELEAQAETLKQAMIKEMDNRQVDKLPCGEFEIRYTVVESSRLDSKKLKSEHSDLYNAYSKSSTSTRFQVA
jgi:predicted phage-related endonuclease